MATNLAVATRLCSVITDHLRDAKQPLPAMRPLAGSNLKAEIAEYRYRNVRAYTKDLFIPLSQATSYSTVIAEIVWNNHAETPELWLRPRRYSNSTSRHMHYIVSEFVTKMVQHNFAFDRSDGYNHIYYTDCIDSGGDCRVSYAVEDHQAKIAYLDYPTYQSIIRNAARIDEPKLHSPTRKLLLTETTQQLQTLYNLMAKDVPMDYMLLPRKNILMELTETLQFLQSLQTLADSGDIKALRLAVRGWMELEKESGHV